MAEKELLKSTNWKENGYELFSIADISGANPHGYLQPIMECNCMFAPAESFKKIAYADERFTLRGGGAINLHMFRSLGLLEGSTLIVLPGEGSFHQYHGGVTTSEYQGLEQEHASHSVQLQDIWQGDFHSLRREPILLGAVTISVHDPYRNKTDGRLAGFPSARIASRSQQVRQTGDFLE